MAETPPPRPQGPESPLLRELGDRLQRSETLLAERRDTVKVEEQRRRGRDRSQIAKVIVYLFAVSFILLLIVLPLLAVTVEQTVWTAVGEKLLTLVSSVLLPVVTLVIGYYFGSEQSGTVDDGS